VPSIFGAYSERRYYYSNDGESPREISFDPDERFFGPEDGSFNPQIRQHIFSHRQ